MNFEFSDDQLVMKEEVRKLFEKEDSVKRNRNILEGDENFDKDLWNKVVEMGLTAITIPEEHGGIGLGFLELCVVAEEMGRSGIASEVFNCSAPDTGNMEVIERYGNDEHKKLWLEPLLNGEIRSAFAMTEPNVASSDATNISSSIVDAGDHYVINGEKWWTSGAGDPRCKILVFMGVTNPDNPKHQRQSQILVPMDTPGIEILRMMNVFGSDDAPHGHGHLRFTDVKIFGNTPRTIRRHGQKI